MASLKAVKPSGVAKEPTKLGSSTTKAPGASSKAAPKKATPKPREPKKQATGGKASAAKAK